MSTLARYEDAIAQALDSGNYAYTHPWIATWKQSENGWQGVAFNRARNAYKTFEVIGLYRTLGKTPDAIAQSFLSSKPLDFPEENTLSFRKDYLDLAHTHPGRAIFLEYLANQKDAIYLEQNDIYQVVLHKLWTRNSVAEVIIKQLEKRRLIQTEKSGWGKWYSVVQNRLPNDNPQRFGIYRPYAQVGDPSEAIILSALRWRYLRTGDWFPHSIELLYRDIFESYSRKTIANRLAKLQQKQLIEVRKSNLGGLCPIREFKLTTKALSVSEV